jgi:hypothetical protein
VELRNAGLLGAGRFGVLAFRSPPGRPAARDELAFDFRYIPGK